MVLDAFARVGGATVRMAGGGTRVVANEWSGRRLECLMNNAKVYEVDKCIEISENDFLKVQRNGIEVVFAQPPLGDLETDSMSCLSIVDFQPTLDKIISKSLSLANNFMLLLPAAISVDVLCSCINKCATEHEKMKDTCSATIEKIYWQGKLKYILLSVGRLVQEEIKLSHELNFIYERLLEPEKGTFRHKKIVKILREDNGMMFLLNLVKESEKKHREKKQAQKEYEIVMDSFLELIRQRSLINKDRLDKLLLDLESPNEKKRESHLTALLEKQVLEGNLVEVMEEEKMNEDLPYFRHS